MNYITNHIKGSMKHQYFIVYAMTFLLMSCGLPERAIQLNPYELSLKIPENYNQNGYKQIVIYQDKIIGFNFSGHCFDVYDLKKMEPMYQIALDSSIRFYFNGDYAFKVVKDTFYLEGEQKELNRMDFKGNLIDKISLVNGSVDLKGCSPFPSMQVKTIPLALSNNRNFYANLYVSGLSQKVSSSFLKFNIPSQNSTLVENSAFNIDLDGYGFMAYPEITVTSSEKLIFSWPYTDSIYILKNDQYEKRVLHSKVFNGTIDPHKDETMRSFMEFIKKAYRYENLVYMENLRYYARIIHSEKRESQFDTSSQYLCIFNDQGKELVYYKLEENVIPFIFVWGDKLVLQLKMDQENLGFLKFLCFPIQDSL